MGAPTAAWRSAAPVGPCASTAAGSPPSPDVMCVTCRVSDSRRCHMERKAVRARCWAGVVGGCRRRCETWRPWPVGCNRAAGQSPAPAPRNPRSCATKPIGERGQVLGFYSVSEGSPNVRFCVVAAHLNHLGSHCAVKIVRHCRACAVVRVRCKVPVPTMKKGNHVLQ